MTSSGLKTLTAGALALGLAAFSAQAQTTDITAMTDEERAAFGEEIRDYLLNNPEVLVEVIQKLEDRQAAEQANQDDGLVAANAEDLFQDQHSWEMGNPDGDVVVVEFLDYQCGFCKKAFPEVKALLAADKNIRVIVKEYPILGEASVLASRFAIATLQVAGEEAYKSVHDGLMEARGRVNEALILKMIKDIGLDAEVIRARMGSEEVNAVLEANRLLGQRLRINGTPSFVFGEELVRGYVPLDAMKQIVAEVRESQS